MPLIAPPALSSSGWSDHLQSLSSIHAWDISGRVAIRQDGEAWNLSMRWSQDNDRYDIRVSAPLGQGAAHFYGDALSAALELPDEPLWLADSIESALQERLGWYVPVAGMRYWLVGRPDPAQKHSMALDEEGRLERLAQSGWMITYDRYTDVNGRSLPRKIEMESGDLRVRFVIDQWKLASR